MRRYKAATAIVLGMALLAGCGKATQSGAQINGNKVNNSQVQAVNRTNLMNTQFTAQSIRTQLSNATIYDETYINEIAKTVNAVNETAYDQDISYVFITDTHIGLDEEQTEDIYREIQSAVDVANNSDVDFLCLGGDIEDGRFAGDSGGKQTALDILQRVSDILKGCNKPVFILKGNHDDNSFSAQVDGELLYDPDYIINSSEWYQATMANFSQYATDYQDGYYYYDIPGKDTRVICLNMSNSSDEIIDGKRVEMGMYYYGYHDEQIEWLLNTAMTRTDCKYVFLCHDAFDFPEGYNEKSNRDVLANILKAAYTHTNFQSEKFAKDFTNWNGKVLMYNNGHMHMEKYTTPDMVGGLPLLSTETAALYNYGAVRTLPSPWNTYTRTEGRSREGVNIAAYDIVIYQEQAGDNGNDAIRVVKFGNGSDAVYNTTIK